MELAEARQLAKGAKVTVIVPNQVRYHGSLACAGVNERGEASVKVSSVVTNTTNRPIKEGSVRSVNVANLQRS